MLCAISRINPRNCVRLLNLHRQNSYKDQPVVNFQYLGESLSFQKIYFRYQLVQTMSSQHRSHVNRLINEKSPYLLQHAHNPVNWYPWSDEALQLARTENKLIFLSIGYSTCHWCHVMERESFENEETAKIMNEKFINIKVDREERPEIDKLYMTFIVLINGSGGWPLSIFLTPDLAPITGGTYFPPTDRWGVPGFSTILNKVAAKWETSREDLTETGLSVIDAIRKSVSQKRADGDNDETPMSVEEKFQQAVLLYKRAMDREWGGTHGAPKFPEVSKLNFLFHAFVQTKDKELLEIVLNSLDKIANGGIHDHVFGGFARYSVDKKWHVPHFEKMLYDQGQLLMAYSNAYKITRNPKYLQVADKIFKYITKDLYHSIGGGFYSGEDADSLPTPSSAVKVEGAFYAWDYDEVKSLFDENKSKFPRENAFEIYKSYYNLSKKGNVEPASDPHGHLLNMNILIIFDDVDEIAEKFSINEDELTNIVEIGNSILHGVRETRPRPHLDRKIITAWNGLVLSGISKLACVNDAPNRDEYLKVASKLIEFLKANSFDTTSRKLLRAVYGEGDDNETTAKTDKPIYGFLDDYAFLIKGLIDYYVATLDTSALHWAKELQELQNEYFWDAENGGYFYSEAGAADVIVRMKEDHDGAEPAGNSVAAQNLILLGAYFDDKGFKEKASRLGQYFSNVSPMGYSLPEMLSALLAEDVGLHMMVAVGPNEDETKKFMSVVKDFYVPGLITIPYALDKPDDVTRKSAQQFKMIRNLPTAYCCHNRSCNLPITDPKVLADEFASKYLFKEIL